LSVRAFAEKHVVAFSIRAPRFLKDAQVWYMSVSDSSWISAFWP
jgi:hypothetical protein